MAYMLVAGLYLLGIKLSPKSISRLSLLYPRVVRRWVEAEHICSTKYPLPTSSTKEETDSSSSGSPTGFLDGLQWHAADFDADSELEN
ncbi:hypothetical protein N7455_009574 [Penicillium solitum]|uniref:uncharacterized protein n=1 Tax=Penicillium solitum TaxID=60172 RepID=UPI0032C44258|nr:hypothetical protein N7455_009574 [Penicillium solitum]